MKKLLLIFVSLLAFGALAHDPHDAALKKNWTEMFRGLKDQKSGLNTVKSGKTLLDIAITTAPYDVRHTLIQLGGTFACMFLTDEDRTDQTELTTDQNILIAEWVNEFGIVETSPADDTPLCDGEPCVDFAEVVVPRPDNNAVKRALNFGDSIH